MTGYFFDSFGGGLILDARHRSDFSPPDDPYLLNALEDWAGWSGLTPRSSWATGHQRAGQSPEQIGLWATSGEGDAHTTGGL